MPPKPVMQIVFGVDFIYWFLVTVFGGLMLSMFVPRSVRERLMDTEIKRILHNIFKCAMPISNRTKGIINDMFVSNPDINTGYPFDMITVPTLIIHDVNDPAAKFSGAESMARQVPGSCLERFEGGGHLLIGHEDMIQKRIQAFIHGL
jgi:pimeloyl-ACP methyl ester carboxylesterase